MDANLLWKYVSARPIVSIFLPALFKAMLEQFTDQKTKKAKRQPFQVEAAVLASLLRMEEFWSNYCLCYVRCTTMVEYQEGLVLHNKCILQVR
jgi:hypothetical protein